MEPKQARLLRLRRQRVSSPKIEYRPCGDGSFIQTHAYHGVYMWPSSIINDFTIPSTTALLNRNLWTYRLEDPAHRILSCQDPRRWTMPRGRPHAPWLRQVESYLKDTGWRLPGRWPDGGRRSTVARWTRRRAAPAYAPIPTYLDRSWIVLELVR